MSSYNRVKQWEVFGRVWHLFDAKWQNPFHSADKIAKYLSGQHKPIYYKCSDIGDHVVVINTRQVAMPGDEWRKRVYFHHTGFPGGATWTLAWELHKKNPTMVLWKAVYKKLGCHQLDFELRRGNMMQRLHLFPDDKVPPEIMGNVSAQIQQLRPMPKRLDEYTEEERLKFPKVIDWPDKFVPRIPR